MVPRARRGQANELEKNKSESNHQSYSKDDKSNAFLMKKVESDALQEKDNALLWNKPGDCKRRKRIISFGGA